MAKRTRKPATAKTPETMPGLAGVAGMDLPECPPELVPPGQPAKCPSKVKDGHLNPEHFRWRVAFVTHFDYLVMIGKEVAPKGWDLKKSLDAIIAEAETYGISRKHLADIRTEAEKSLDGFNQWREDAESIFAQTDDVLSAMEKTCDQIDLMTEQDIMSRFERPPGEILALAGKVRAILLRVRTLRDRARNPVPATSPLHLKDRKIPDNPYRDQILAAGHTLRFAVYTYRTTIGGLKGSERVLAIGMHHVRICADIWQAKTRCHFWPVSRNRPHGEIEVDRDRYDYEGAIEIAPPSHGKTTTVIAEVALMIDQTPDLQGQWLHALQDEADKNVEAVKDFFRLDKETGRRNLSLFPGITLSKFNNGRGQLNFDLPGTKRGVTLEAFSVTSSRAGSDCTFQILDDVVPQSDAREPTERENRSKVIAGTWIQRLRGKNTLRIIIGTMWHYDDALCRLFKKARPEGGCKIKYVTRAQSCRRVISHGGQARFEPLWPEMYPAKRLKALYTNMAECGDEDLWNYAYEANMQPDSKRLIHKLRLYAADIPEHAQFCADAEGWLSVDPTFTNREHSDPAGMLVARKGRVKGVVVHEGGGESTAIEDQLRIVHAQKVDTTADGMKQVIADFVLRFDPIDDAVIETNNAGGMIVEQLENEYGFTVHAYYALKSKMIRMRRVMHMLNDSESGARACVLFPGRAVRDENGKEVLDEHEQVRVEEDPQWSWLYAQVLQFGFTSDDHCVDAITQLCAQLSTDLSPGRGVITRAVRRPREMNDTQRAMRAILHRARGGGLNRNQSAEAAFIKSNWG